MGAQQLGPVHTAEFQQHIAGLCPSSALADQLDRPYNKPRATRTPGRSLRPEHTDYRKAEIDCPNSSKIRGTHLAVPCRAVRCGRVCAPYKPQVQSWRPAGVRARTVRKSWRARACERGEPQVQSRRAGADPVGRKDGNSCSVVEGVVGTQLAASPLYLSCQLISAPEMENRARAKTTGSLLPQPGVLTQGESPDFRETLTWNPVYYWLGLLNYGASVALSRRATTRLDSRKTRVYQHGNWCKSPRTERQQIPRVCPHGSGARPEQERSPPCLGIEETFRVGVLHSPGPPGVHPTLPGRMKPTLQAEKQVGDLPAVTEAPFGKFPRCVLPVEKRGVKRRAREPEHVSPEPARYRHLSSGPHAWLGRGEGDSCPYRALRTTGRITANTAVMDHSASSRHMGNHLGNLGNLGEFSKERNTWPRKIVKERNPFITNSPAVPATISDRSVFGVLHKPGRPCDVMALPYLPLFLFLDSITPMCADAAADLGRRMVPRVSFLQDSITLLCADAAADLGIVSSRLQSRGIAEGGGVAGGTAWHVTQHCNLQGVDWRRVQRNIVTPSEGGGVCLRMSPLLPPPPVDHPAPPPAGT
uniref:Uncharacterized protein n=1 Tax=Branchiostoma floridae TaxID=7739 RepID=C3ZVC5_BRAFL|eukprot:XP_002587504.1 hypothetical protein BRAFLDRAFT_99394 [Branchiostoma floridae]